MVTVALSRFVLPPPGMPIDEKLLAEAGDVNTFGGQLSPMAPFKRSLSAQTVAERETVELHFRRFVLTSDYPAAEAAIHLVVVITGGFAFDYSEGSTVLQAVAFGMIIAVSACAALGNFALNRCYHLNFGKRAEDSFPSFDHICIARRVISAAWILLSLLATLRWVSGNPVSCSDDQHRLERMSADRCADDYTFNVAIIVGMTAYFVRTRAIAIMGVLVLVPFVLVLQLAVFPSHFTTRNTLLRAGLILTHAAIQTTLVAARYQVLRKHFGHIIACAQAKSLTGLQRQQIRSLAERALPERFALREADVERSGRLWDVSASATVAVTQCGTFRWWAKLRPVEVVAGWHHLYTLFDGGAQVFNCDRGCAMGDAYVVTAGLLTKENCAIDAVRFTLWQHALPEARAMPMISVVSNGQVEAGIMGQGSMRYVIGGGALDFALAAARRDATPRVEICRRTAALVLSFNDIRIQALQVGHGDGASAESGPAKHCSAALATFVVTPDESTLINAAADPRRGSDAAESRAASQDILIQALSRVAVESRVAADAMAVIAVGDGVADSMPSPEISLGSFTNDAVEKLFHASSTAVTTAALAAPLGIAAFFGLILSSIIVADEQCKSDCIAAGVSWMLSSVMCLAAGAVSVVSRGREWGPVPSLNAGRVILGLHACATVAALSYAPPSTVSNDPGYVGVWYFPLVSTLGSPNRWWQPAIVGALVYAVAVLGLLAGNARSVSNCIAVAFTCSAFVLFCFHNAIGKRKAFLAEHSSRLEEGRHQEHLDTLAKIVGGLVPAHAIQRAIKSLDTIIPSPTGIPAEAAYSSPCAQSSIAQQQQVSTVTNLMQLTQGDHRITVADHFDSLVAMAIRIAPITDALGGMQQEKAPGASMASNRVSGGQSEASTRPKFNQEVMCDVVRDAVCSETTSSGVDFESLRVISGCGNTFVVGGPFALPTPETEKSVDSSSICLSSADIDRSASVVEVNPLAQQSDVASEDDAGVRVLNALSRKQKRGADESNVFPAVPLGDEFISVPYAALAVSIIAAVAAAESMNVKLLPHGRRATVAIAVDDAVGALLGVGSLRYEVTGSAVHHATRLLDLADLYANVPSPVSLRDAPPLHKMMGLATPRVVEILKRAGVESGSFVPTGCAVRCEGIPASRPFVVVAH